MLWNTADVEIMFHLDMMSGGQTIWQSMWANEQANSLHHHNANYTL